MTQASPWREDPSLAGRFHPQCPDDIQVLVHDGEPRRTRRAPEACWARVSAVHGTLQAAIAPKDAKLPFDESVVRWAPRTVYRASLLNQPHQLQSVKSGDEILFVHAPGIPHPLRVLPAYLEERPRWAFAPCDRCGADQSLDPPTVMARTRFPDAPAGSVPVAFTAFCPCGGTMILSAVQSAMAAPTPLEPSGKKPWWKVW